MTRFDAFHLPVPPAGPFHDLAAGTLSARWPEPAPALLDAVVDRLLAAGERLRDRPVASIIEAIDRVAARLEDPADPIRREAEALVPAATGYHPAMVRLVLDRMAADWRAPVLRHVIATELGGPDALDGFVDHDGRAATALPPRLAFHVFSGNVPGVAVTSLVRALLVRAPSFGKLAAGEPVLPVLFARALAAEDPALGDAIALTYWPGGSTDPEDALLRAADTLIVYGGEQAVTALRPRIPGGTRLVEHGPRISVGAIGAAIEGGIEAVASRAARAVATFDQQGCVSPHALWVEGTHERAEAFAAALAAALRDLEKELPRGTITPAEASAIQQERGTAEMRAHADPATRVWAAPGTAWTVVLEPADRLRASCLNRFVRVHPIADLAALPALLAPVRPNLQAVALEGAGDRLHELARRLAHAGASRITTFDRLPWPPAHAHHDGAPPLRELLRWADLER